MAAIRWLEERGLSGDRLILFGNSLGAVPAALGATQQRTLRPDRVILEAPFPGVSGALQGGTGLSLPGAFVSARRRADPMERQGVPEDGADLLPWVQTGVGILEDDLHPFP